MAVTAASPPQFLNKPEDTEVVYDFDKFRKATKKNVFSAGQQAAPPLVWSGPPTVQKLANRGCIGWAQVLVYGTLTVAGAGPVVPKAQWPYNLIKKVIYRVNSQEIMSLSGPELFALEQIMRDNGGVSTNTRAGVVVGANTFRMALDIPVMIDKFTMIGLQFAETQSAQFEIEVQWATQAETLTIPGGTTAVFSNVTVQVQQESYDVPRDMVNGKPTIILPPTMHLVHMLKSQGYTFDHTGENVIEILRPKGQLSRIMVQLFNGAAAGNLAIDTALNSIGLQWGGNVNPLHYNPTWTLLDQNAKDYAGPLLHNAFCLDFLAENAARDAIMPRATNNLALVSDVNGATVPTPGQGQWIVCEQSIQSTREAG